MRIPLGGKTLAFPARAQPWGIASFHVQRAALHDQLGPPHYIETDDTRTFGGHEDTWGWALPGGLMVFVVLSVPYDKAMILCDPHEPQRTLNALDAEVGTKDLCIWPEPSKL